jgi:parallel beta-helix repeat protein
MHQRRRLTTVSLIATAALITAMAPVSAAGSTTRYVDGDGHASPGNCDGSGSAYRHIQKAVNASGHGDTVIVCPGTYQEQVTIKGDRDGLTLKSSKPYGAIIKTPTSLDYLYGIGSFTTLVFIDHVDDITVQGFRTIVRTAAPCDNVWITIFAAASRRTAIRGNRLLAPGASPSSPCGQYFGVAIVSSVDVYGAGGRNRSSSATVGFNEVRDTLAVAIQLEAFSRAVTADVVHNSVRAYFGHAPAGSSSTAAAAHAGSSIAGSAISGVAGINALGRVQGSIRSNVVQGSASGPADGPYFYYGLLMQTGPGLQNGPISIHDNIVRRVALGLYAGGSKDVTIERNQVTNTRNGMVFQVLTDSTVRHNTVGAVDAGIIVDSTSSGNAFRHDTVTGAGGTCSDDSVGGGTAGTANSWSDNTASVSSDPAGICAVEP